MPSTGKSGYHSINQLQIILWIMWVEICYVYFYELIVSLKKKKSSPKDFQYNQISYVRQTCKNGKTGE